VKRSIKFKKEQKTDKTFVSQGERRRVNKEFVSESKSDSVNMEFDILY
jgi:hypothetical protein